MTSPAVRQITSSILVGRTDELGVLEHLLRQAQAAQGQTVLLAGEAGIGKTRLAQETKALAAHMGFSLLQGNCFEPDRTLPYAPILDLLRTCFLSRPTAEVAQLLGPWAAELALLFPELFTLLPDLLPAVRPDFEPDRHRLFQAFEQFLVRLSGQAPLLILIEDIQWSDDTSLDFLLHLARRLTSTPLLLLLTYRFGEEPLSLTHFLAELDRQRLVYEVQLPPLGESEIDHMLRAIFEQDRPMSAEFLHTICDLTEGNPFFIEELLKSLLAAGDIFYRDGVWDRKPMGQLRIPRTLQLTIQQRAEQLAPDARQLLTLAALIGRRFDFLLLQTLTGADNLALFQQLKELIAAQLIVEESTERFAFRHALIREAVYASLLARERQHYHGLIATTMERLYAERIATIVDDLAYHYYQAQRWQKALHYSRLAGEKAQKLYAPREASKIFTWAIEAGHQLATPLLASLYRARGQSYEVLGEFERARADYRWALEMAQQAGDRQAEWQSLIDLGFLWAAKDYMKTGDYFRDALELAHQLGDPVTLARSLNRLGNWYVNVQELVEAQRCHEEALAIFEALDDKQGLAETLDLLGLAYSMGGQLIDSFGYYERSTGLFRELDDRRGMASCLALMGEHGAFYFMQPTAVAAIPLAEALEYASMALEMARQIGWRSGEAYALIVQALCSGSMGNYGPALDEAHKAVEIAEEIEHRQWMTFARTALGLIYLDLLDLPAARRHLEEATSLARQVNSPFWIHVTSGFLASLAIQEGEPDLANGVLNNVLAADTPLESVAQKSCWAARLELALAQGDGARAQRVSNQLLAAIKPDVARASRTWQSAPRLLMLHGQALAAVKRFTDAEASLYHALEGAQAQGARPLTWRIHLALGQLYRRQRQFKRAEEAFALAEALIEELATELSDGELRENFRQQALARLPRSRPFARRRMVRSAFGGLTEREREVAALVGQGMSNRDIADALVISERTVEKHISNILGKLALDSRAQLIVWALESGLSPGQRQ